MGVLLDDPSGRTIFCADAMHSPVEICQPDVSTASDTDRATARVTRRALLEEAVETGRLVSPGAFRGRRCAMCGARATRSSRSIRALLAEVEMKLGLYLRNMGPQSTRPLLAAAARAAEAAGIDDLWVADHLALAPEDSEGSNGRYLEPLATLAFLAGITERVGLGVGVLIVPYRPALLTAKWIATIQELSGERLILGIGVGWMDKEFRALGVDRRRRGAITDATLAFLHACFAADEVEANGQPFLFRPRPARPPIVVGGAPPHAIGRAVRFGDGWMPTALHAEVLDAGIASLREGMAAAGKPAPEVVLLQSLPVGDDGALAARLGELAARGVTRVVHPWRYEHADEVARVAARLVAARDAKAPRA